MSLRRPDPKPLPDGTTEIPVRLHRRAWVWARVDNDDVALVQQHSWYRKTAGYAATMVRGSDGAQRTVYMHRLIADFSAGVDVDHHNGVRLDNRRANLRPCNDQQNQSNVGRQKRNTTGFKGVTKHRGRFHAAFRCNGVQHYVGTFDDPVTAHNARVEAARRLQGAFFRE